MASARVGLTPSDVATQISAGWLGATVPSLRALDRAVPVRVRYPDAVRRDTAALAESRVRGGAGELVPLSSVATATISNSQSSVLRENLRMMALVTARLEGRDLGSAVGDLQKRLAAVKLPVGYSIEIGGQVQSQRQAFLDLRDGPRHRRGARAGRPRRRVPRADARVPDPLRRRRSPLGGAFLLLVITRTDLNVSSAMGLILLVGLVVKNGIVLMDFAARRHAAGSSWRDALLQAGARRLRPILMTTLCTLCGAHSRWPRPRRRRGATDVRWRSP